MNDPVIEYWRPVKGFEGLYEVSSAGQVRSLPRGRSAGCAALRPGANRRGHLHVTLSAGNVQTTRYVHKLVAEAFIGPCPDGQEVRHWDGNPANNTVGNLRYGTRAENLLDAVRHGTHYNTQKTHCDSGHEFTPENTYSPATGGRACRECRRRWSREWAQRARQRQERNDNG